MAVVKAAKRDCPAVALLFLIAPTEVHRDFTSDVHVRRHFCRESILIHCCCKIAYCPSYSAVRCIIREIFDSRSDRRRPPALAKLRTTSGVPDASFDAHLTQPLLQTRFEARQIKEVSSQ